MRQVAEAGLADSQYAMGMVYADGTYAKKDLAEARKWFEKAAA